MTECPECKRRVEPLRTLDGVCLPCEIERLTWERDAALYRSIFMEMTGTSNAVSAIRRIISERRLSLPSTCRTEEMDAKIEATARSTVDRMVEAIRKP